MSGETQGRGKSTNEELLSDNPANTAPSSSAPSSSCPETKSSPGHKVLPSTAFERTKRCMTRGTHERGKSTNQELLSNNPDDTVPSSSVPSSSAPSSSVPSSSAPSTSVPSSSAPSTSVPSSSAPSTSVPSSSAPSTSAPSTSAPSSDRQQKTPEKSPRGYKLLLSSFFDRTKRWTSRGTHERGKSSNEELLSNKPEDAAPSSPASSSPAPSSPAPSSSRPNTKSSPGHKLLAATALEQTKRCMKTVGNAFLNVTQKLVRTDSFSAKSGSASKSPSNSPSTRKQALLSDTDSTQEDEAVRWSEADLTTSTEDYTYERTSPPSQLESLSDSPSTPLTRSSSRSLSRSGNLSAKRQTDSLNRSRRKLSFDCLEGSTSGSPDLKVHRESPKPEHSSPLRALTPLYQNEDNLEAASGPSDLNVGATTSTSEATSIPTLASGEVGHGETGLKTALKDSNEDDPTEPQCHRISTPEVPTLEPYLRAEGNDPAEIQSCEPPPSVRPISDDSTEELHAALPVHAAESLSRPDPHDYVLKHHDLYSWDGEESDLKPDESAIVLLKSSLQKSADRVRRMSLSSSDEEGDYLVKGEDVAEAKDVAQGAAAASEKEFPKYLAFGKARSFLTDAADSQSPSLQLAQGRPDQEPSEGASCSPLEDSSPEEPEGAACLSYKLPTVEITSPDDYSDSTPITGDFDAQTSSSDDISVTPLPYSSDDESREETCTGTSSAKKLVTFGPTQYYAPPNPPTSSSTETDSTSDDSPDAPSTSYLDGRRTQLDSSSKVTEGVLGVLKKPAPIASRSPEGILPPKEAEGAVGFSHDLPTVVEERGTGSSEDNSESTPRTGDFNAQNSSSDDDLFPPLPYTAEQPPKDSRIVRSPK